MVDVDTANLTVLKDEASRARVALFWREGQAYVDLRELAAALRLPYVATVRAAATQWAEQMLDTTVIRSGRLVKSVGLMPAAFTAWLNRREGGAAVAALREAWPTLWRRYREHIGVNAEGRLTGEVSRFAARQLTLPAEVRSANARKAARARWGEQRPPRQPKARKVSAQKIRELHHLITVEQLSGRRAAKQAGVSTAVVSLLIAGKYPLPTPELQKARAETFGAA